jgi:Kef-type K+ transport system membrane component KefB
MFIVGAELRLPIGRRRQLVAAGWIAVLSVLVPMALGLLVALPLHDPLAPPGVTFWPFALFMAAALSMTAFPVMAHILKDRQMTQTTIGRLALTSAAMADVLVWMMVALVVVLAASHDWSQLARTVGAASLPSAWCCSSASSRCCLD